MTIIKTIITHKEGEVKLIKAITSKEKTKMEKLTRVTGIEEEGNILIEEDIIIEKDTKEDKSTKNKINKQTNSIRWNNKTQMKDHITMNRESISEANRRVMTLLFIEILLVTVQRILKSEPSINYMI